MAKNLSTPKSSNAPASDSTPGGMKTLSPTPTGNQVRNISGPKVMQTNKGGDLVNNCGVDSGTTVESP